MWDTRLPVSQLYFATILQYILPLAGWKWSFTDFFSLSICQKTECDTMKEAGNPNTFIPSLAVISLGQQQWEKTCVTKGCKVRRCERSRTEAQWESSSMHDGKADNNKVAQLTVIQFTVPVNLGAAVWIVFLYYGHCVLFSFLLLDCRKMFPPSVRLTSLLTLTTNYWPLRPWWGLQTSDTSHHAIGPHCHLLFLFDFHQNPGISSWLSTFSTLTIGLNYF